MGVGGLEKTKEDQNLMKSHFEKFVRDVLVSEGIQAIYEPIPFPIRMNGEEKPRVYLPDFVTSVFLNGKPVVLEVHSFVEIALAMKEKNKYKKKLKWEKAVEKEVYYVEKINEFRESYGTYVIIISSMPKSVIEGVLDLKIPVDEYWFLKYHKNPRKGNHYKVEKLSKHLYELKEKGEVKKKDDLLHTLLVKLKERDEIKNEEELLNIFNSKFIENVDKLEERRQKPLKEAYRGSEKRSAFKDASRKNV